MFIRLHLMERMKEKDILIRPEEIAAIERHYNGDELGSVLFLRSNSESIYVTQSQQEVYELILKEELLRSIDKELKATR